MGVGNLLLASKGAIVKHRRTILTIVEIGSFVYGVYRAYNDGPKFKAMLEEIKSNDISTGQKVKKFVVVSAPVIGAAVVNVTAAVCNQKIASKEIAQLGSDLAGVTTALNISQSLKAATEAKAREVLGDEAVDKVHEAVAKGIAKDEIMPLPSADRPVLSSDIIQTGHGNDAFKLAWDGTKFYSDINFVKKIVNDCNYQLMNDMFISVNEFKANLGLPGNDSGKLGWNMDYGQIDCNYYAELDDNGKPVTVIYFRSEPSFRWEERNRW